MSVRVRLTRVGSKKNPIWRVVVADQRSPRDGRSIENLGYYNPQTQPSTIVIDRERMDYWLERGAQPSGTVKKLLRAPNTEAVAAAAPPRSRRPRRTPPRPRPTPPPTWPRPPSPRSRPLRPSPRPPRRARGEPRQETTSEPDPEAPAEDAPAEPEAGPETGSEPDPEAPSPESA